MKFIKRMRSRSHSVKAQYAFFIALFCTLVIAFVWSTTLPARFSNFNPLVPVQEETKTDGGSLTDIFNEAKMQVGNVVNWDETEQPDVTTTNLDALSEGNTPPASTSPEYELPPEEESGTTTEGSVESETPRTVLIEVREKESEETSSEANQEGEDNSHTQTLE